MFTASHDAFWAESRKVNGDTDGTSELIDVLLLHRTLPAAAVIAGIDAALRVGAVTAEVVAVEARRADANLLTTSDVTGGASLTVITFATLIAVSNELSASLNDASPTRPP